MWDVLMAWVAWTVGAVAIAVLLARLLAALGVVNPSWDLGTVQERSFAALPFPVAVEGPLAGQPLTGAQVTVVQRSPRRHPWWLLGGAREAESFWYCKAPDGRFFLAVAHNDRRLLAWDVRWLVRPLDAMRMRGALAGDDAALALAFGDRCGF
ncbi:hypothetical protein [Stenotrophomonas sp. Marseille-Q4652]|uniref:hypothetical protein n=1 Tax=Stenotrophomonas sp. Marseille-Q4652 TaxID=2866595 RepID=UPI001CE4085E|nr:hypothetical protein [Stenotrophomonas sp. Marseille-Q4652]